jgi:hypothetical protein
MSKKTTEEKDKEEKIDWEYEPLLFKQEYYALLICGLIIFAIGAYLTITNGYSKGISQNRFGGGHEIEINGPQTLVISSFFLIPWLGWSIKKALKKREHKK